VFDINGSTAITVIGIRISWMETHNHDFAEYYARMISSAKQGLDSPPRIDHYKIGSSEHFEDWDSEPTADDIRDAFNRLAPKNYELTIVWVVSKAH
jgi:hypothetical protein